jgi:hypothetical protein
VRVKRPDVAPHKKFLEMAQRNAYCALQHIRRMMMADETKVEAPAVAQAAAEAPAKVAEALG